MVVAALAAKAIDLGSRVCCQAPAFSLSCSKQLFEHFKAPSVRPQYDLITKTARCRPPRALTSCGMFSKSETD